MGCACVQCTALTTVSLNARVAINDGAPVRATAKSMQHAKGNSMVYLLHFDESIGGTKKRAQHYMGFTVDPVRIEQHSNGTSHHARIVQVFHERGIGFHVARTWEGDRKLERRLKSHGHSPRLCPTCNPRALLRGNNL